MFGKCPKCGQSIASLRTVVTEAVSEHNRYRGVTYTCPTCSVVLGAGAEPNALIDAIATEVTKRLRNAGTPSKGARS